MKKLMIVTAILIYMCLCVLTFGIAFSADTIVYYKVFRSETIDGSKLLIATTTETDFKDYNAVPGKVYYYWIKTCIGNIESNYSLSDAGSKKVE